MYIVLIKVKLMKNETFYINNQFCKELENFQKNYIRELKVLNKSKHTISSYSNTIKQFIIFLKSYEKKIDFYTIKKFDMINFLDYKNITSEKQKELPSSSKRTLLTHLKLFFNFIEENAEEMYDFGKVFDINIKIPKKMPKGLSNDEQIKLLNYLEKSKDEKVYTSYRNSFIIKILLYAGLRNSEMRSLKYTDFNFDESYNLYILNICGKGNKERELYINKDVIEDEFETLRENFDYDYICKTSNNRIMDSSELYRMVKSIFMKLKIEDRTVHSLRHSFAQNLLKNKIDIVVVQQLLGHSSLSTTTIYTTLNKKTIKESIKEYKEIK
jgi:site-specific recombinase XerD